MTNKIKTPTLSSLSTDVNKGQKYISNRYRKASLIVDTKFQLLPHENYLFGEIRGQPYDAGIYSLVPADDRKLRS